MDSFRYQSFNFDPLVENYEGKSFEDLYENFSINENEMGQFLELIWKEDEFPHKINLNVTKKRLMRNLKTVYQIGEVREKRMFQRGIKTLKDLTYHMRYKESARKILDYIGKKDFKNLINNRYICDIDASFCFDKKELLFLDIETLGLYDSPIIMIGLGYYTDSEFEIHILFARNLEEEIAICEHLKSQVLPSFKCFISYNGKSFDVPYIANRLLYFFDENPMIDSEDVPYKSHNTLFHHIDLYHNCRRKFKGEFTDYTLTTIEEQLLQFNRENDLPSSLVPRFYEKYLRSPQKFIGLVKEIIDHNYFDIYSMPLIFQKLLE
jgi:hypothetical protein